MFRFDSAEFADRESAAWVALQVFDVSSGTRAGLFQRLHRAVAMFAAHHLATFGESFEDGAWQPTTARFDLTLRHHRWFLLGSHG